MSEWYWPWERGTWPTTEQLWDGLNAAQAEERRTLLDVLIMCGQNATMCQDHDHRGELVRLREQVEDLGRTLDERTRQREQAETRAEAFRLDAAAEAKHRRVAERRCAEEDHEGIAQRLSALLCELTNGRMSKTNYDVRTMVAEIDSVYTEAQQESGP